MNMADNDRKIYQFTINDIAINFPRQPYDVQVEYVKKLLECLKYRKNGLLESPTGTGKTLCLLCGSLAWLEHFKACQQYALLANNNKNSSNNNNGMPEMELSSQRMYSKLSNENNFGCDIPNHFLPKIIYCSRTHSQLSQVVKELKKTSYNHVSSVVLASRDQLCLLPEVANLTSSTAKLHSCRAKVKSRSCPFFTNVENKLLTEKDFRTKGVMDIEDLVTLGKKHTCCPYYAARELKSRSDIIFAPYNYLLDPKTRRSHGIQITNNVIIFDEAHNIESVCEESMSFYLKSKDLAFALNEISQIIEKLSKANEIYDSFSSQTVFEFSVEDAASLKVMLSTIETELDKAAADEPSNQEILKPGKYIFEVLRKAELTFDNHESVENIMQQMLTSLTNDSHFGSLKGVGLGKICDMLVILFDKGNNKETIEQFDKQYKISIQKDDSFQEKTSDNDFWNAASNKKKNKKSWILSCHCLTAKKSMQDMMNQDVHCLILTSGTLSPLSSFALELEIPFQVDLENPHIIDNDQILVAVVNKGSDGTPLTSAFKNRSNPKYINSLGMSILNFSRVIPKGMLTVFPSYSVMDQCLTDWKNGPLWNSLSAQKTLYVEPKGRDSFSDCMSKYSESIADEKSKGALLFAVARGKVSEGLDFSDNNARCVIITGIPFAPLFNTKTKLKKQYLDENKKSGVGLSGNEWYTLQAVRAVNQAIGRVIRHRHDYGAILLCDNRFSEKRHLDLLSSWVRHRVKVFNDFGQAQKGIVDFFRKYKNQPQQGIIPRTDLSSKLSSNSGQTNIAVQYTNILKKQTPSSSSLLTPKDHSSAVIQLYSQGDSQPFSVEQACKRKESVFDAIEDTSNETRRNATGNLTSSQEETFNKDIRSNLGVESSRVSDDSAHKKRKINLSGKNLNIYQDETSRATSIVNDKTSHVASIVKEETTATPSSKIETENKVKMIMKQMRSVHGLAVNQKLTEALKRSLSVGSAETFLKILFSLSEGLTFPKKTVFESLIVLLPYKLRKDIPHLMEKYFPEELKETGASAIKDKSDFNKDTKDCQSTSSAFNI